jgi:hypothetical protein
LDVALSNELGDAVLEVAVLEAFSSTNDVALVLLKVHPLLDVVQNLLIENPVIQDVDWLDVKHLEPLQGLVPA